LTNRSATGKRERKISEANEVVFTDLEGEPWGVLPSLALGRSWPENRDSGERRENRQLTPKLQTAVTGYRKGGKGTEGKARRIKGTPQRK